MLPVMQVGRVRPGAPPEHDVLHPVGGGLGQARPTNNIGMHGISRRVWAAKAFLKFRWLFLRMPLNFRPAIEARAVSHLNSAQSPFPGSTQANFSGGCRSRWMSCASFGVSLEWAAKPGRTWW
ncbi:MAG: hypothetical protein FJ404_18560 [Verrucomicrobia bacterium]|nr:hypothetical protein [Verrucomicrobiota bacterium]